MNYRPSLSFVLLLILLATLWIAGGSSRADQMGQVMVRGVSFVLMIVAILFCPRPHFGSARPVLYFLLAAIALVLLQLIPLPPGLWLSLPGRAMFADAATLSGQPQPWRPLAIVPSAAVNAAGSLVVPLATLLFAVGLREEEKRWLPGVVLAMIAGATIWALLQFSGSVVDNPLINDSPPDVSGIFANRNHLALFLSFGLVLIPVWAFPSGKHAPGRAFIAAGLALIFSLTILATGSRVGMLLGLIALGIGLAIAGGNIRQLLARYPRWLFPAVIGAFVTIIALLIVVSFTADRAQSINRVLSMNNEQDFRSLALPTVLHIARTFFPVGYGFGGFDPIFQIYEPFALLDDSHFNHAHNDVLEILLEGGIAGAAILLGALVWWIIKTIGALRAGWSIRYAMRKIGAAMVLLILIASFFDYPARTPTIMAMIVLAGLWLSDDSAMAAPRRKQ